MRSKNRLYVVIAVLIVSLAVFFFSSPYWIIETKENRTQNYNTVFELERWKLKISNASYESSTRRFSCELLMLTLADPAPELPTITAYNGRVSTAKKPLQYVMEETEIDTAMLPEEHRYTDTVMLRKFNITIENVSKDYWYVSLNFKYTIPSAANETLRTDVFGQTLPTATQAKERVTEKVVQIDNRELLTGGESDG